MVPTLFGCHKPLVASEDQNEHNCFCHLEHDVNKWEQVQRANGLRREGHLKYSGAQLNVLTTCLHGNSPSASAGRM